MLLPPIDTGRSLAENAADRIREQVLIGGYRQGQHLVEAKIAEELQISRGPVREAFKMLRAEGLLNEEPRRGTFVVSITAQDVRDIYGLRAAIEGAAARQLCLAQDPERVAQLERGGRGDQRGRRHRRPDRRRPGRPGVPRAALPAVRQRAAARDVPPARAGAARAAAPRREGDAVDRRTSPTSTARWSRRSAPATSDRGGPPGDRALGGSRRAPRASCSSAANERRGGRPRSSPPPPPGSPTTRSPRLVADALRRHRRRAAQAQLRARPGRDVRRRRPAARGQAVQRVREPVQHRPGGGRGASGRSPPTRGSRSALRWPSRGSGRAARGRRAPGDRAVALPPRLRPAARAGRAQRARHRAAAPPSSTAP